MPRARKPSLVYSFRWDLEGVTRREERQGKARWGEVRPGTKKEKLIAGTHAQHSIQIMEWLDRTTTFIFARVHRLPPGKAAYLDWINWRAGCVTSARPILIIKQREHPALASLPSLSLSLEYIDYNREFNSRRMINYARIYGHSRILRNIYRLTAFAPPLPSSLYGCSRPRMIAPRFTDLIFRGARTPLSRKCAQWYAMMIMVLLIAPRVCFFLLRWSKIPGPFLVEEYGD